MRDFGAYKSHFLAKHHFKFDTYIAYFECYKVKTVLFMSLKNSAKIFSWINITLKECTFIISSIIATYFLTFRPKKKIGILRFSNYLPENSSNFVVLQKIFMRVGLYLSPIISSKKTKIIDSFIVSLKWCLKMILLSPEIPQNWIFLTMRGR